MEPDGPHCLYFANPLCSCGPPPFVLCKKGWRTGIPIIQTRHLPPLITVVAITMTLQSEKMRRESYHECGRWIVCALVLLLWYQPLLEELDTALWHVCGLDSMKETNKYIH